MTKKLIDSNILVYAIDTSNQRKHATANKLIFDLIEAGSSVLSTQNLAEFSRALERAKPPVLYNQISLYVSQLTKTFQIINYTQKTVIQALQIASNYRIHFFDALLAATMEENSITEIVTENEKDFSKIPWLSVHNPFRK